MALMGVGVVGVDRTVGSSGGDGFPVPTRSGSFFPPALYDQLSCPPALDKPLERSGETVQWPLQQGGLMFLCS